MILQALVDYYYRKAAVLDSNIAPPGFENKEIPFLIILNEHGEFVGIEDTREKVEKKLLGKKFIVPLAVKRTIKALPNFLWDTLAYVFGVDNAERATNIKALQHKKELFLNGVKGTYPILKDNVEIQAVVKFLESDFLPILTRNTLWQEVLAHTNPIVTFQIAGRNHLVCQNQEIVMEISSSLHNEEGHKGICLLTGEIATIARLHHSIKGLKGAQSSGANIVSYNIEASESYFKEQGNNAPIGEPACFAYTTALNHLLCSNQKIAFGETITAIFWAECQNSIEDLLAEMLETPPKDDPDRMTRAVKSLYDSPNRGSLFIQEDNTKFYIMGLSPNNSRLSISFWWIGTVGKLAANIKQHFDDLEIISGKEKQNFFSLYQLLRDIAVHGDFDRLPSRLVKDFLMSILQGTCYPQPLLTIVLGRLKDKDGITVQRAALMKAWLNRYIRKSLKNEKEVQVSLDDTNGNIGYCLGRLFAVLEKTQEEAHGKNLNTTIRDRFYGGASSVPVTVFPNLMKLKNHHLAKLENRGRAVNLEKLIGEIMEQISDFPSVLSLVDQGRFAIGYYHQRHNFFKKSES